MIETETEKNTSEKAFKVHTKDNLTKIIKKGDQ